MQVARLDLVRPSIAQLFAEKGTWTVGSISWIYFNIGFQTMPHVKKDGDLRFLWKQKAGACDAQRD